ncbi:MAG: diacylglycerol kinase [Thermoleophilia bacterium]|nr:diacylglycerol kinase [Thermoleophilia bacterium]
MTTKARPITPPPVRAEQRVRGLLVINPYSSGMTSRREVSIVSALRERMDLEVRRTERPGHAPRIVEEFRSPDDIDVIIACGGDGTANEVLNGMSLANGTAQERPAFAIIPAGGTNVLARSVGMRNHPVRAIEQLADAIVERRATSINLGTVDERIFMFSAGVGLDAEVVKRMSQRRTGRRPSDLSHLVSILGLYASQRFALGDVMTIDVDGDEEEFRAAMLLVGNTTPWTYVGRIPMHFTPDCTLQDGLDFIAPAHANAAYAMRNAAQAMGVGRRTRMLVDDERARLHHDVDHFTVTCDEPLAVQADGEYLGDLTHIEFGLLRDTVRFVY